MGEKGVSSSGAAEDGHFMRQQRCIFGPRLRYGPFSKASLFYSLLSTVHITPRDTLVFKNDPEEKNGREGAREKEKKKKKGRRLRLSSPLDQGHQGDY
ncbi:hypothetical protein NL676_036612 [Syzygium grande]|nr:hypothetical protein NL676_036612 [Syzygium grande]